MSSKKSIDFLEMIFYNAYQIYPITQGDESMSSLDQAVQTHLKNIQKKTGKSLEEMAVIVKKSGYSKHAEIREMLMHKQGLSYGDANAVVHAVLHSDGKRQAENKSLE